MVIEGLLHCFGVRTKARALEPHQWLVESQAAYADLVKDVHELLQFSSTKIAACTSCLDSLDREMQNYRTGAAQVAVDLEICVICGVARPRFGFLHSAATIGCHFTLRAANFSRQQYAQWLEHRSPTRSMEVTKMETETQQELSGD